MTTHIPQFIDASNPPRPDKKTVTRDTVQCIVHNKKTNTVLCLNWKVYGWQTFIIGGVEAGENAIEAGKREVLEETGYKNLKYLGQLGGVVESHYFAAHKDENRIALVKGLYFELIDDEKMAITEDEAAKFEIVWVPFDDIPHFVRGAEVHELWQRLEQGNIKK